jgi:hypothetical protein
MRHDLVMGLCFFVTDLLTRSSTQMTPKSEESRNSAFFVVIACHRLDMPMFEDVKGRHRYNDHQR